MAFLGRGDVEANNIAALAVKFGSLLSHQDLRAARSILWLRRNRQTYWTSTSPSAAASRGPVQRATLPVAVCRAASKSVCRWLSYRSACLPRPRLVLQPFKGHGRHSDAAKGDDPRFGPQLPWRSTGCCARPPPTELSVPASNRAAKSRQRQHASSTLRSFLERWTSLASGIIPILNHDSRSKKSGY